MILADNGSAWYVSGTPHPGWDDDALRQLHQIVGNSFEAVDTSSLMVHPDSAQVRPSGPVQTPTPTATPAATPTLTPPSCSPRPPIRVTSAPSSPGVLSVTIRAGTGTGGSNNSLQSLQVAELTNARVELGSRELTGGETVALPAGIQQATLTVRRVTSGVATTVRLVIRDACGPWPTFVGGGPTAF